MTFNEKVTILKAVVNNLTIEQIKKEVAMNIPYLLFLVLWFTLSGTVVFSNIDLLIDATPRNRAAALLVLIIFAPIIALNNIVEDILDLLLDGHDEDDKWGKLNGQ